MNAVFIFLGGGLGSLLRYGISVMSSKWILNFPLGTFISNLIASIILVLAVIYYKEKVNSEWINFFVMIGFCGGLSTFSTFSYETMLLFQSGNAAIALVNIVLNVSVCILAVYFLMK